jgi:phage-related protein
MAPKHIEPEKPAKTTTLGVRAGQVFERLSKLDREESAELANAPLSIRRRFEARRAKTLAKAGPDVAELVKRMRESERAAE